MEQIRAWVRKHYYPPCACGQTTLLFQIPKIRDDKFHTLLFCGDTN